MLCNGDNCNIQNAESHVDTQPQAKALHLFNGLIEIQAMLPKMAQKKFRFIHFYQGTANEYMS